MGKEIGIFFAEENPPEQYQQYVGKNVPSVHPSIFGVFSAIRANELLIDYPNFDINNSALTSRIFAFWDTLQEIYTGAPWPNANGYPAPVSGQKGTLTGFTVINGEPVVDGGDYKAIYNALYNRFGSGVNKYPLTYGIGNLGFRRTTPINVFVSLDSPEASSFIRTDPMMSNLSPAERQKKLREMLASGNEYVKKMLGADFPGTGAVPPGEYDPFKQAPAGEAGDTPGVEISNFDTSKMEKDYGQIAGFDATYEMIKGGQVPFMKPPEARQLLLNPKYQKLWDDDPGALKTIQRLAV